MQVLPEPEPESKNAAEDKRTLLNRTNTEIQKKPNIADAWNYYKMYTLPRYKMDNSEGSKTAGTYTKVEAGDKEGELYGIIQTPLKQLGDFGLGVFHYYNMCVVIGIMLFFAGIMNCYAIHYYKSDSYSEGQAGLIDSSLEGSAICTVISAVCTSAVCTTNTLYLQHKDCEITLTQGLLDYFTIIMLFLTLFAMAKHQNQITEEIDEENQTAQDYSIVVQDPSPEDIEPEKWKAFFEKFGHVTYVTVSLNNGPLLTLLSNKRLLMEKIMIEAGGENSAYRACIDTEKDYVRKAPRPLWLLLAQKAGFFPDLALYNEQLKKMTKDLAVLQAQTYTAAKVYIVFEKEDSQRRCLKKLTTGLIPAMMEKKGELTAEDLFDGDNVLKVEEASEPNEVIWINQYTTNLFRLSEQAVSMTLVAALVGASAAIISVTSKVDPAIAAIFISISNSVLPTIIKMITTKEHHLTDSSQQASLLLKIVMLQWMNTGFIIYIVTDPIDTLEESYVKQVSKILWADAFTTPVLLIMDPAARLSHYVLSRRAKSQLKMNSYFRGTSWFLAERYAGILKSFFVANYFSAIFPSGYFIAALGMFMNYWASKYCLLRLWRCPPMMGDLLTKLARGYVAIAILVKLMVTLHFYAGWPHDRACALEDTAVTSIAANVNAYISSQSPGVGFPSLGDPVYLAMGTCTQTFKDPWTVLPTEWMPHDQAVLTMLYSISAIVVTVLLSLLYFGKEAAFSIYHLFHGAYKMVGKDMGLDYSGLDTPIATYVPLVINPELNFPLLAVADLKELNKKHVSAFSHCDESIMLQQNLNSEFDLPGLSESDRKKLFGRCINYPPVGAPIGSPIHALSEAEKGKKDDKVAVADPGLTILKAIK